MEEERHLEPVGKGEAARVSVVITLASLVGHLARLSAVILAVLMSAVVLFGLGVYSVMTRVGSWWRNGLKMITIGLGAAAICFLVGRLLSAGGA
jgi:VIT1/CCC1 family predicted Fe2+/Mn2+ transporter